MDDDFNNTAESVTCFFSGFDLGNHVLFGAAIIGANRGGIDGIEIAEGGNGALIRLRLADGDDV